MLDKLLALGVSKSLLIASSLVVVAGAGVGIYQVTKPDEPAPAVSPIVLASPSQATSLAPSTVPAVASAAPKAASPTEETKVSTSQDTNFTEPIFDPNLVSHITPLGELNGGYEEAQALAGVMVNLKSGDQEIEVKAPTDMTLERYSYHKVGHAPGANWALIFRIDANRTLRLDHLTRAPENIMAATTQVPKEGSADERPKQSVKVKAGQVVGYTSGTKPANNWNIYLYDTRTKNSFINQKRFEGAEIGKRLINASCIFNYYGDSLKTSYLGLMGYSKAGQSSGCGSASHDVVGTASGMWFLSSDPGSGLRETLEGSYASPLSIIKNSAGEVTIDQLGNVRYDIRSGNSSLKDPAEIKGEHCYTLRNSNNQAAGYMYLSLTSATEMKIAFEPSGNCPSSLPASAKTYYR